MSNDNEFSENYYVKKFLTYYAGLVANLTDGLEKQAKDNLKNLTKIDKKAKDILIPTLYTKYKRKKTNLIKSFDEKLIQNLQDEKISNSLSKAKDALKKLNI